MLAQGLAALGVRVCMAAFEDGVELPDVINGVKLIPRAPYQARRGLRGKLSEAGEVHRSLAEANAEVVLARGATPAVALVAWSARSQRRRFVYSSANVTDFDHAQVEPSSLNRALVRHGIGLAEQIVVQTQEQQRLCERCFGRTPHLISSIAAPALLRDSEPRAFLWVGRAVWYKQPFAYVELARRLPEARFWMLCVPEPVEESRRLIEAVQAAAADLPNLELLAPVPRRELAALIAHSVAVVNTSEYEGLSNVFLEAWAQGVPGIALSYDPDGLIQRHRLGGFAGGSAEALVLIARALWDARADQSEVSERCQRYVRENHAPDAVNARWCRALGFSEVLMPDVRVMTTTR